MVVDQGAGRHLQHSLAMRIYPKYFNLVARKGIGSIHRDGTEIVFKYLTLAKAKMLWEDGLPHLHITPEGARELYADSTPEQRAKLILEVCKTPEEIEAIALLKPGSKLVTKAAADRAQQLLQAAGEAPAPLQPQEVKDATPAPELEEQPTPEHIPEEPAPEEAPKPKRSTKRTKGETPEQPSDGEAAGEQSASAD